MLGLGNGFNYYITGELESFIDRRKYLTININIIQQGKGFLKCVCSSQLESFGTPLKKLVLMLKFCKISSGT